MPRSKRKGSVVKRDRKIIVYIATSADGYIARPDGSVGTADRSTCVQAGSLSCRPVRILSRFLFRFLESRPVSGIPEGGTSRAFYGIGGSRIGLPQPAPRPPERRSRAGSGGRHAFPASTIHTDMAGSRTAGVAGGGRENQTYSFETTPQSGKWPCRGKSAAEGGSAFPTLRQLLSFARRLAAKHQLRN